MYDYAFVHLFYTIPLASILTIILWPLFTKRDVYKICFLISIAVLWTTPWDSYLIHERIWTYPPDVIIGPTIFQIPIEEVFFFCIQTYIGTCLHILLNKPVLIPTFLRQDDDRTDPAVLRFYGRKRLGQILFSFSFLVPLANLNGKRDATYMRLISVWASPVLYLLWSLSYQLLIGLPYSKTLLPITLPTLYLWIVDTLALKRGTWSIETGTKLGINIWPNLEIEEAVFFLVTNTLIVFGSCAFDNAVAILDAFPDIFPIVPVVPSPILMLKALLVRTSKYDTKRLEGLQNALNTLAKKSRSFYLASGVFSGRLRIDLVILYSYCRVADDLIDNAENTKEAEQWIKRLTQFLDVAYSKTQMEKRFENALSPFPENARTILALLPVDRLPAAPLYSLLDGFRSDLKFSQKDTSLSNKSKQSKRPLAPPIQTEADLELYASRVASTVAELCISLVYHHDPSGRPVSTEVKGQCIAAGARMGLALQYINIVRDVQTDAETGRCYIPNEWFDGPHSNMTPEGFKAALFHHRQRILDKAFQLYEENRDAIEDLPEYARGGIRVAVESYVEIGRVMRQRMANGHPLDMSGGGRAGRASVPKLRRLWVGWRAMSRKSGKSETE